MLEKYPQVLMEVQMIMSHAQSHMLTLKFSKSNVVFRIITILYHLKEPF